MGDGLKGLSESVLDCYFGFGSLTSDGMHICRKEETLVTEICSYYLEIWVELSG